MEGRRPTGNPQTSILSEVVILSPLEVFLRNIRNLGGYEIEDQQPILFLEFTLENVTVINTVPKVW